MGWLDCKNRSGAADKTEEDARGVAEWRASTSLEVPTIPTGNVQAALNYTPEEDRTERHV